MFADNAFSVKQCPKRVERSKECFCSDSRETLRLGSFENMARESVLSQEGNFMSEQLHLYVRVVASPGAAGELKTALQSLSQASLVSGLCLRFDVSQSILDQDIFHLFESFESESIYPNHVATSHAQHFLNVVLPNCVAEREVVFLKNTSLTI
jgi:quinol monooxygenase YgiN